MVTGLNSEIKHRGRAYHVQTQHVHRAEPAVETLIYEGGCVVVRMTMTIGDLAEQFNYTGEDIHHLLDLQHWNLVRKIRYGMLDGGETEQSPSVDDLPAAADPQKSGVTDDPSEFEDADMRELHAALDDRLAAPSQSPTPPRRSRRPRPRRATGRPARRIPPPPAPSWRQRLFGWIGPR
jgi:hypothetical protein